MLTNKEIKSALEAAGKAQKPLKRYDQDGLFLLATATGSGLWRFKYVFDGREKLIGLGKYPDVSLKQARDRRDDARKLVADHVDPSAQRQAVKAASANDFESVAEEWLASQKHLERKTVGRIRDRLKTWIYPTLGRRPIVSIKALDILALLKKAEVKGRVETAHRTRSDMSRVLRYAVAHGQCERDVTVDLRGGLTPVKAKHFAAVTSPEEAGALMRAIAGYRGQPIVEAALRIAPYVAVRPGELRSAEWTELDLAAKEWRIPAHKTKMRRPHIVPLSTQVVALLEDLKVHSGGGRLCFPTVKDPSRNLSENTLNACLRRLGYSKDQMTSHGFRTIFSTLMNERGVSPDLIEKQLAHKDQNETRDAYNRAQQLVARRALMQQWADYLDVLGDGGANKVVPINRGAAA